jgi:probable HAF family extracellular repeat protein
MTNRCRLFVICLFSIHVFCQFAYCQSYQVVDLGGMIAGSTYSVANDINNSGYVIISADIGGYLYSKDGIQLLPTPSGYTAVAPFGLNDQNQIGVVAYGTQSGQIAFFFSNDNYYLMGDAGGAVLDYIDLNNNGQVLWGGPFTPSYLYDFNTRTSAQLSVIGYGINDAGQIAGSLNGSGIILNPDGQIVNLGAENIPYQINNLGYATGSSTVSSNPSYITHAFLWTPTNGVMDINDNAMAATSSASAINNRTEIVGYYQPISSSSGRAFYYKNGQMTDLNNMIPANSGWTLTNATAINDLGQIVGMGTKNGSTTRAFLLNPQYGDFVPGDCDVDGSDLAVLIANISLMDLTTFALNFGKTVCQ